MYLYIPTYVRSTLGTDLSGLRDAYHGEPNFLPSLSYIDSGTAAKESDHARSPPTLANLHHHLPDMYLPPASQSRQWHSSPARRVIMQVGTATSVVTTNHPICAHGCSPQIRTVGTLNSCYDAYLQALFLFPLSAFPLRRMWNDRQPDVLV